MHARVVVLALISLFGACGGQITVEKTCGHAPNHETCMGAIQGKRQHIAVLTQGAALAVDALYNDQFRRELSTFIDRHADDASVSPAWAGWNADTIVAELRREIAGRRVSTFGGVKGLVLLTVYGTKAFEAREPTDPVTLNRWSLKNATRFTVANTIIHEVAHGIGLTHPHSDDDLSIARCEPPYVLGSLAEKTLRGSQWQPDSSHCHWLTEPAFE
jgi:hypothetical protein